MQGNIKKILTTFILGGLTGVLGQILVMAFASLGLEGLALPMSVLFTMGIIGCIMVLTKASDKLEKTGTSVGQIAFYGLSIAMSQAYMGLRGAGASIAQAFVGTWKFFAIALIPGMVIAVSTGVIWTFIA